jgi:predicted kinase
VIAPGDIILVTGIMAAGKSTVTQALAERVSPSVHLRGDSFRRMIVNGQEPVTPENWPAAQRQLHLRYELAVQAAVRYAKAGFIVCYQDVIVGPELATVTEMLDQRPGRLFVVVLVPDPVVAMERDRARSKTAYGEWTPDDLDASLRSETKQVGLWLDSSRLTVEETVDAILDRLDQALLQPVS